MINLYLFIIIPIILGTIFYIAMSNKLVKIISIILEVFLLLASIRNFLFVREYGPFIQHLGNLKQYIGISLRGDLISSILVMITIFLFLIMLIFNYSKSYSNRHFVFLFLILQSLITGIFLSNDLFNIYIFLEVSTVTVSILIMHKRDSQSIYDGMIYLIVNIIAATFFLFGVAYLYKITGHLDFYGIAEVLSTIDDPRSLIIPYSLIITGVSLKCALLPLFSWLPKAHSTPSAPSVVSAVLSGLYVKSGLYLFIRIQYLFIDVIDISEFFVFMGLLTSIVGFIFAISQTDIKMILAYSTVSQIGLIMIGLNYDNNYTYWGGILHMINHVFFKSLLFLTAGLIIEEYHTRDITKIKGVFKRMPFVSVIILISVFSITGAPLFSGSISKYLISYGLKNNIMTYFLNLINLGTILYCIKFLSILFGPLKKSEYLIPFSRKLTIITLAVLCIIGGVLGNWIIQFIFNDNLYIDLIVYIKKSIYYFVSLIIGFVFYRYFICKVKWLNKIKIYELSLNNINLSIIIFFFITLSYLGFKYIFLV